MPHIHTGPNQHDMTMSAYIIRREDDEWKCMVHFHRKVDMLMQIGGHIELDETPWQTVVHELREESGYTPSELKVMQYTTDRLQGADNVMHPTPLLVNTHYVGNEHYHSDLCYGIVAHDVPERGVAEGESTDIRWLTIDELKEGAKNGTVLTDVVSVYEFYLRQIDGMVAVDADTYSLEKPLVATMTYKRGAPGSTCIMKDSLLTLTRFGNPILREKARHLTVEEIKSDEIQQLITDIRYTNQTKKYGVGLAAPQVGVSVALSVIGIKPTPNHPDRACFDSVIINPNYEGIGKLTGKWEGCQSGGTGDDIMFGKAMRYGRIQAKYYDENGKWHDEELTGFPAHVFQHECDHLYGILFVDKVRDTTTFMMADEYRERVVKKTKGV